MKTICRMAIIAGIILDSPAIGIIARDYTKGVFIVNEDWYGHRNSTLNYLDPADENGDYFHYMVFQEENLGMEIGCTTQFGTIFNGRLYLISKQAKDQGAKVSGGRITVADAGTLKVLAQLEDIDPSGALADGRSFVGVTPEKGYISTSDGVWIFDLVSNEVKGRVEGTAHTDDNGAGSDGGQSFPLYYNQSGSMAAAAGKVFVAHQSAGLLVIDPGRDCVVGRISVAKTLMEAGLWTPSQEDLEDIGNGWATIEDCGPGIGSVISDRQGMLWLSVAGDINGSGTTFPAIIRVDPVTLTTECVSIPATCLSPTTSWYAWTPDTFCASATEDALFYVGGSRWFGRTTIFRYDIVKSEFEKIVDLDEDGENWKIYGCSMRVDPRNGEIYASLYRDNMDQTYVTRRYTSDGMKIADYPMISNYWFPSIPIFPGHISGISEIRDDNARDICYCNGMIYGGEGEALIFDISGSLIAKAVLSPEGTEVSLPAGLYVVCNGARRVKIILKN